MTSINRPFQSRDRVDEIIDHAAALHHCDGDVELLHEVAALFLDDCPRRLVDLRDAGARQDAKALDNAAHSLKGSAGNFGAEAAVAAAERLEQMARAGDLSHAAEACIALEEEIGRLCKALERL